mgnify:CR=1 FL=1
MARLASFANRHSRARSTDAYPAPIGLDGMAMDGKYPSTGMAAMGHICRRIPSSKPDDATTHTQTINR